ncbi:MAG: hypothetical protein ACMG6E_06060 [Candidatus Roizmanbacteria bacterium]
MAEEDEVHEFSEVTKEWLGGWLSGGKDITDLPTTVIAECQDYLPTDGHTLLYKALTKGDKLVKLDGNNAIFIATNPSSWTYDFEMSKNFKTEWPVVSISIGEASVLIDTTMLDPTYIMNTLGGFPDEREVILLPGTYRVTIRAV